MDWTELELTLMGLLILFGAINLGIWLVLRGR